MFESGIAAVGKIIDVGLGRGIDGVMVGMKKVAVGTLMVAVGII